LTKGYINENEREETIEMVKCIKVRVNEQEVKEFND